MKMFECLSMLLVFCFYKLHLLLVHALPLQYHMWVIVLIGASSRSMKFDDFKRIWAIFGNIDNPQKWFVGLIVSAFSIGIVNNILSPRYKCGYRWLRERCEIPYLQFILYGNWVSICTTCVSILVWILLLKEAMVARFVGYLPLWDVEII